MKLKIANLVAIQFGIFVGMMAWLVYSHFDSAKPQRTAEERPKAPVNSAATSAPVLEPAEQRPQTPDYRADPDRVQPLTDQPVPVVQYEYSPEAVQQYSALAAQLYYRQIAPRPAVSSAPANSHVTANAPTYAQVNQAPAVEPVEYEEQPPTVAYEEPVPFIAYPQVVAYSYARPFARRCRPTPHHRNTRAAFAHNRPNNGGLRGRDSRECRPAQSIGIVQRRNDRAPSCRPSQGFAARGKR
jgi:hypothetical protein